MNILFVGVECFPFAKVGGLGDVMGSLPGVLNSLGEEVRVILPKYPSIKEELLKDLTPLASFKVYVGTKPTDAKLNELIYNNVHYYFIESEKYFGPERKGVYNCEEEHDGWVFFQMAVLESIKYFKDFEPDIIHCHDWHVGMIPHLVKTKYYDTLGHIKTIFTIHNIIYQGDYPRQTVKKFNIKFDNSLLGHNGKLNYMRSAITAADFVNTVSKTYAKELTTSEFLSYGMRPYLRQKAKDSKFIGIINGIDYSIFNPETDNILPLQYDFNNYREGKLEAKKALYEELGVDFYTNVPMIGIVSRLTEQKGLDLIMEIIEELLSECAFKFIVVGTGDQKYEDFFKDLEKKHPYKVKCFLGYSDKLAHLVYGASDMFLMPSKFEPCGLGQMIALRYGSLPIVRETGGLNDSVEAYNEYELTGNGFSFTNYNSHDMLYVIKYAFRTYSQKHCWDILVQNAMASDYSFESSAKKYIQMYKKVLG